MCIFVLFPFFSSKHGVALSLATQQNIPQSDIQDIMDEFQGHCRKLFGPEEETHVINSIDKINTFFYKLMFLEFSLFIRHIVIFIICNCLTKEF